MQKVTDVVVNDNATLSPLTGLDLDRVGYGGLG